MNPLFGSRKQADEFDRLLSRSSSGHSVPDAPERYDELLGLVATLRETRAPQPRSEFSAALRERLMTAAETVLTPDTAEQSAARRTPAARHSPRERRIVAAVGGFAIVSATASMAVAAQSALPGDTLYPLKRAIENAQTGVQQDADGKGTTLLGNATGRLDEVGALTRDGDADGDAEAITGTLDDFVAQASEASDLLLGDFTRNGNASSIEELRTFTADSMGALTGLQSVIPKDARAALISATQVINAIDIQAQSLCPACTDLPIMEAPVFAARTIDTLLDDALGPVLDTILPAAPEAPAAAGKGGKGGAKNSAKGDGPSGAPSQEPASTPDVAITPPAEPRLPQVPEADGGKKDRDKGKGGLLDSLNVSGSDDPIGDLLTGTGEVVDELLDGVGDGLDGLGGLGGLGGR